MQKRQIIGIPLRFPFSEIYADDFGQGKCREMSGERFGLW